MFEYEGAVDNIAFLLLRLDDSLGAVSGFYQSEQFECDMSGIHDQYKPMIEDFEIRIYSRWGELVYYSNDKDFKWNGEVKGRINRQVIYNYMITFTDKRGVPYQLTGSITVL